MLPGGTGAWVVVQPRGGEPCVQDTEPAGPSVARAGQLRCRSGCAPGSAPGRAPAWSPARGQWVFVDAESNKSDR
jgi:hypothetical protein